jgi:hypothetical protein
VLLVPGFWARTMQIGRKDYGGLGTKILYNQFDKLYILDTETGISTTLAGRHGAGTWAASDDSEVIAVTVLRGSGPNFDSGPLDKVDLVTGMVTPIAKWGTTPDWR